MQGLRSRNLIGAGKCKRGLYRMRMFGEERQALAVNVERWHKRLGHTSQEKLAKVDFLKGVSFNLRNNVCDSCSKAKHTRSPFPLSEIKIKECFELLHCDVWGKYRVPSFSGAKYFLTIVDDFSRNVWIFLVKYKNDASTCLMNFCKMVETQFTKNVKRIRCDNGGEFTSNLMLSFYTKQGILLETTCSHTPQQNGVVEHKHRHLLETARALRFEANLPKRFWGECVLTAAYIINRLPSKTLGDKTPFEILYSQKPEYDHMRVFGCLVYFWSIETRGDKFEVRGRPGIFLGYPQGIKGYKIFDIEGKKMVVSRDVKFHEGTFTFPAQPQVENDQDVFTSLETQEFTNLGSESVTMSNEEGGNGIILGPDNFENNEASPDMVNEATTYDESPTGRPERIRALPKHLEDFVVDLPPSFDHAHTAPTQANSTVHPSSNYISYDNFSVTHKLFLAAITTTKEPKSFKQAIQDPKWIEAMKKEIQALQQNNTWTIESLPEGKKAIDSKWVYKIKYKPNGDIERYKARLVAKGFTQVEGEDFHDTFAPVAKLVTVRTLLAVAAKENWFIHQLDVNNAFLHGDLEEEVYMKMPQGFTTEKEGRVCRLRKSLYGLRQASRNWYQKFTNALLGFGFTSSKADHSLFFYKDNRSFISILIYVDDVIIVGNDLQKIQEIKQFLHKKFSIKDL